MKNLSINATCSEVHTAEGLSRLPGLKSLHAQTLGDPRVTIAVLDGPVDTSHPTLLGANLEIVDTLVPNRIGDGPAARHGVHVASIIFGQPGTPVHGIAPNCRGLILPIFRDDGHDRLAPCSQVDLARAIQQAIDLGADVINISGGQLDEGGEAHPLLADKIRACVEAGILVVAAAGNDGCRCLHLPAAAPEVVVVGAMDDDGNPLGFSNWGEAYRHHGILAPGEGVLGAIPSGGADGKTGTSAATPIVSGAFGLLFSLQLMRGQETDSQLVKKAVFDSAIGCEERPVNPCDKLLVGRLNILGAATLLKEGTIMKKSQNVSSQNLTQDPSEPNVAVEPPAAASLDPIPEAITTQSDIMSPSLGELAGSASGISASSCSCSGGGRQKTGWVYALGQLDFDFATEARRDAYQQHGLENPHDPKALLQFLEQDPTRAAGVTWVLNQESTPIYAVQPGGPFASDAYARLRRFLHEQREEGVERISIPGIVAGQTKLSNGQAVPTLVPALLGMYSWATPALVQTVFGEAPTKKEHRENFERQMAEVSNFLERVYYEIRNLGASPQERAINFAATNAFQVSHVYGSVLEEGLRLDSIAVEKSPICRPESDCWDVKLTFFHPTKRLEQARKVYRFTVDVSDIVPVTIGQVRSWHVD